MDRIGTGLLKQSKSDKSSTRKDILSVLAQANSMEEKGHQMSEGDVLARAYNIILDRCMYLYTLIQRSLLSSSLVMKQPGTHVLSLRYSVIEIYQFSSITMTWALYALSQNKEAQTKLREEIYNVSTDNPTMDDLNGLPYMDAVVRETLRLYPPVGSVGREASKDDCIPLSKPFTDKKRIEHNEIR